MKIHYKGMTIKQTLLPPSYSEQWIFGSKKSRIGWDVVGVAFDLASFAEAKKIVDNFVDGKIVREYFCD